MWILRTAVLLRDCCCRPARAPTRSLEVVGAGHGRLGPLDGKGDVPIALFEGDKAISSQSVACRESTLECAVPLMAIGANPGSPLEFVVVVQRCGNEIERWPRDGLLALDIPTSTYDLDHWTV